MLRLPHLKVRVPKLRIRPRLPRLRFRRYQAAALWALVAVAALATLPSLVPGEGGSRALGGEPSGVSPQDEAAARYQAFLRGRAAAQNAAADQAAAQQAAAGPGAAAPTPTVTTPTAADTDIPAMALRAYRFAESWASGFDPNCKLSWSVLAGIGRIESNHGRHFGAAARFSSTGDVTPTILGPVLNGAPNTGTIHDSDGGRLDGDTVWDRAVGPMQFIPSTWQSLGRDGNGDGVANPNNLFDAAVSAAGYLCLSGGGTLADQTNLRRAVFAYNHSWDYVAAVLSWANFYLRHEGQGSLVQVEIPAGPSSSAQPVVNPGGTGIAPTPGVISATTTPVRPTSPPSQPGTSATSSSTSSTRPPTTLPPTIPPPPTDPPPSSTTTTTIPPDSTAPCETTTTSSTSSTSTTTTTTTTTTSSTTTTTTLPPCTGDQQGDPGQADQTESSSGG
jgi:membrane-bound lytic murein transglycosylase B